MASKLNKYEVSEPHMGTLFTLTAFAPSDPAPAFRAAFNRIAELDEKLSDYKPGSELNRLCRAGRAEGSDDLLIVLTAAQKIAGETDGAFDVTQGPVIRLWREARRQKQLPSPAALIEAADRSGYQNLTIQGREVRLALPGMQLDLGGIAKGYAADAALDVLKEHGIRQVLVAGSGDLAIGDPPPDSTGWRVGVGSTEHLMTLSNCAVSTSGDSEQYAVIDGTRYSHIINPHTHTPLTSSMSVSVIARHGLEADPLATAVTLLGETRGKALIDRHPGVLSYSHK